MINKLSLAIGSFNARKWLRRFGVGGFIFFLLKGLAWLLIGYLAVR